MSGLLIINLSSWCSLKRRHFNLSRGVPARHWAQFRLKTMLKKKRYKGIPWAWSDLLSNRVYLGLAGLSLRWAVLFSRGPYRMGREVSGTVHEQKNHGSRSKIISFSRFTKISKILFLMTCSHTRNSDGESKSRMAKSRLHIANHISNSLSPIDYSNHSEDLRLKIT